MDSKFASLYLKMKRFKHTVLLFCCFAFTTQLCEAQPYESIFGEDSTSLYIVGSMLTGAGTLDYKNYSGMDTVINGNTYSVFKTKSVYLATEHQLLREDTDLGKVYQYSQDLDTEITIMNLSLSVGDSFYYEGREHENSGYYLIDSVYFENGKKKVRLDDKLNLPDGENLIFIEGVGTNIGLFYKGYSEGFSYPYLICSWKDGTNIFGSKYYDGDCDPEIIASIEEEISKQNAITLYPNPASQYLKVESQEQNIYNITIFNMSGKEMINRRLSPDRATYSVQLNIEKFPSGIYFLSVETPEETVIEKIIKL